MTFVEDDKGLHMPFNRHYLPATLYHSTHSLTFDGVAEFMAWFSGFGNNTFPINRNRPSSYSLWLRYEGPANPNPEQQTILSRWFATPSAAINEGGHRSFLASLALSGNPLVTRAMHVNFSTSIINGIWVYTTSSFPLDTWVHVAITWEGVSPFKASQLKIYWDGVEQSKFVAIDSWSTNAIASNSTSHLLWGNQITSWHPLGANPDNPPVLVWYYEGKMDETTLWRFNLTSDEVLGLYNEGFPESGIHIGESSGKNVDTWYRMGERRDGVPFLFGFATCFGHWPENGQSRNAFWNLSVPDRESLDVAP